MLTLLLTLIQPVTAITDVGVVDASRGRVAEHQTVIIDGDKIRSVGTNSKVPEGAKVIVGTGKFLIPGLWDMHVHWYTENNLGLFTANGVTGIRSMFGQTMHVRWKKHVADGSLLGPRVVATGPIVDGKVPIWPGSIAVSTPEQGRAAVNSLKNQGFDFVKVYSLLERAPYMAIADEAKKQGIPFEGHVTEAVTLLEAAAAGQRTNEHVGGFGLASSTREAEFRPQVVEALSKGYKEYGALLSKIGPEISASFESKKADEVIAKLAKTKMWQCPTMVVNRAIAWLDDPEFRKDWRLKYMPPMFTASWDPTKDFRLSSRTPAQWEQAKAGYRRKMDIVRRMHKAGVKVLAGTDCLNPFCFPGFSLHDELALLVECGYSPGEAIVTATLNPAKFYGEEKIAGSVAKGKFADLVLLNANPLLDIKNTTKIETVIQRGKVHDRAALDAILKACEVAAPTTQVPSFAAYCEHF